MALPWQQHHSLVTVLRDKETQKSKGVAFVLYLNKEGAQNCARALNNKQLFGRMLKASIAIDNGRAAEFIRIRVYYTDKSRCYECGDTGHLSYACPKNMLGDREPPQKEKKRRKKMDEEPPEEELSEEEDQGEDPALDSLSQAIAFQGIADVTIKTFIAPRLGGKLPSLWCIFLYRIRSISGTY
ncbi:LOW QUALITY PROTEIN: zinc finger CCHC-type and RNA-binding motif-containing protein 1 [Gastrophryne carolinensis]